jgi:acetyl esterase/lipase
MVAGWSAGGNIAAVTCQLARDRGGPQISGQLLVCPVTDCTFDRPSYNENAAGYFLTRSLMHWFWDLYCSPGDRTDPRVSPLCGKLAGLPQAFVVTCEFDPLRDEGVAYAEALAAAGVPVEQLSARGHFHLSFAMVDVVITGVSGRMQMADALRRFAELRTESRQRNEGVRSGQTDSPHEIKEVSTALNAVASSGGRATVAKWSVGVNYA